MNAEPLVSVVMPVYNTEDYVSQAIESILAQTYPHFEFIIIDDASIDNSVEIIRSYSDKRIHLFVNDNNQGISQTRNRGMAQAKGKYIAVFDSDDISLPHRLVRQVDFLNNHSDFGMIGSQVVPIDKNNNTIDSPWQYPATAEEIPALLLFGNYFAQPSVMLRQSHLPSHLYDPSFTTAGDYELWTRVAKKTKVWNLPEPLVKYRVHSAGITRSNNKQKSLASISRIAKAQLAHLDINLPTEEHELFVKMTKNSYDTGYKALALALKQSPQATHDCLAILDTIKEANKFQRIYDIIALGRVIEGKRIEVLKTYAKVAFQKAESFSIRKLLSLYTSPHKLYRYMTPIDQVKLFVKCLIGYRKPSNKT